MRVVGATTVGKGGDGPCTLWVTHWGRWQGNPRFSEEFVTHLETELEQSRLRESETLGALKEMQDKVLDMEKVTGMARGCHSWGQGWSHEWPWGWGVSHKWSWGWGWSCGWHWGWSHEWFWGWRVSHKWSWGQAVSHEGSWTWCPLSLRIPSATELSPWGPPVPHVPGGSHVPCHLPAMPQECPHLHLAEGNESSVPPPQGVPADDQCHHPEVSPMTFSVTVPRCPCRRPVLLCWDIPTPGCPH